MQVPMQVQVQSQVQSQVQGQFPTQWQPPTQQPFRVPVLALISRPLLRGSRRAPVPQQTQPVLRRHP